MDERELREYICTRFLEGDTEFPIDAETLLLDEGICDSLGVVQIVTWLQSRCPGLKIADQEVTRENFGSIRRMMAFLETKGVKP